MAWRVTVLSDVGDVLYVEDMTDGDLEALRLRGDNYVAEPLA